MYIRKIKSFKVLNNKIILKQRQAFTLPNNMSSSGLWKMLLANITFTIDGTIGYALSDTWCQTV